MTEIKIIDKNHKQDINIPNEPFTLYGKMIPSLSNGQWDYSIVKYPENEITEMTFPDENYDYDQMSRDTVFIGAYENGHPIGLAIMQDNWTKYMYLYDLKVNNSYRGKGIAQMLMEKSKEIALEKGYKGIYTVGQDNNLTACKFYIKSGFIIGGFDNRVYNGTNQQGKADIYFYLDF